MVECYVIWNVIVFLTYGLDKLKAIKDGWRISEKTLLAMGFFMGGVGAYIGMQTFRHKTRKTKFKILIPLAVIVNVSIIILYIKRLP